MRDIRGVFGVFALPILQFIGEAARGFIVSVAALFGRPFMRLASDNFLTRVDGLLQRSHFFFEFGGRFAPGFAVAVDGFLNAVSSGAADLRRQVRPRKL